MFFSSFCFALWDLVYHVETAIEPRCEKTPSSGFLTRSDTNRAVQPPKMARGLKFWIKIEKG